MGRKCFVPNCKSGYASNSKKVRSFKAPRDPKLLTAWAKAIGRTDRQLTPDCYVCEEHFASSAVKKQKYFAEYRGNILLEHHKRSVLKEDAVPTLKLYRAPDATPETGRSEIVDEQLEMSAASTGSDQSQDDDEGSPEKAARIDNGVSSSEKKPELSVENSDASGAEAPVAAAKDLVTKAPSEESSSLTVPKNAPPAATPKNAAPPTVTLNSSPPFLMQTTAPARFMLSSAMSSVAPTATSTPMMLKRTLTPFTHIGAPSTLTLNRALPPMALNNPSSTLLLMPVALIPKQGDNSPASVAMRVVPGNAQLPGNHPPGQMTTALAFRLTTPGPATVKKPVVVPPVVPAKREDNRQQPNDTTVKEELLSEESADSAGGSSDDGGGFAEPSAVSKRRCLATRKTSKTGEPSSGTVRLPLSMALGADQVLLPSPAWNYHDVDTESTNVRSLCFVELQSSPTSGPPFTRRILQIVHSASSGYSIKCYVLDREVEVTVLPAAAPPPTVEEIAETLQDFNSRTVCRGGLARKDLPGARFERAWLDKTGVWRHDRCPLLLYGGETQCKFCASLPNPFNPPTTSTIDKSKLQQKHATRSRVKTET